MEGPGAKKVRELCVDLFTLLYLQRDQGAAKNLIGERLEQTAARWSVANVPRIAQIGCLTDSDGWAAYWGEALGGPATYSEKYGDETSVVRIHSGNGVHEEMDRRAIACFDQALENVGLRANEQLRQVLHDYFAWATTTTMARYHKSADDVPKGLHIPRWSWDGLQG